MYPITLRIGLTIAAGVVGYVVAKKLKFPAAAMIGSMLGVGLMNLFCDLAYMPSTIKMVTQAITGAYIGFQINKADVFNIKKLIKPIVLLMVMLTINTFVLGYGLNYFFHMDLLSALLGCVAGGITDLSLISIDMGADTSIVALLQASRLVIVMTCFPIWIKLLCQKDELNQLSNKPQKEKKQTITKGTILTIICIIVAIILSRLIVFPASPLVLSMLLVGAVNLKTDALYLAPPIKIIAQIGAGSLVGLSINQTLFSNIAYYILPVICLLLSYFIVDLSYGYIVSKCRWLDFKSGLFAASPAGVSDMALIAADLNADMAKIAVIQVVRLVYAISLMPSLIQFVLQL